MDSQWRMAKFVNELLMIRDINSVVQFSDGTSLIVMILILCYCRLQRTV